MQLKVKKAREFLQKGNRVRVMVAFPGRRGFEDAKRMLATLVEQVTRSASYGQRRMCGWVDRSKTGLRSDSACRPGSVQRTLEC